MSKVYEIVAVATARHQAVLEKVYANAPEQAKAAIEKAIEASSRGQEKSLNSLSKADRDLMKVKAQEAKEKQRKHEDEED